MSEMPSNEDLESFAAFTEQFDDPDFNAGEWIPPEPREDDVVVIGWWSASEVLCAWEHALYDRNIIDADSDYLSESNVAFVNESIADPSILLTATLPTLRRALTFLARAERHTGGGWFEQAFEAGMAQAATRRLQQLADGHGSPEGGVSLT